MEETAADQERDRDIMYLLSHRGEVTAPDTEVASLRLQDRVVVVDRGLQHRMYPYVSTVEKGILENVGW